MILIKVFLLSLVLLLTLSARENPFFASKGEKDIPYTSNKDISKPALKRATISLPAQARVLTKVTLEYKNLDGSIEKRSVDLDNTVDWHLPVFISQNYNISEPKQNKPSKKTKKLKYKKITSIKYLDIFASGKKLKIITKDKIIRSFLLVNPHRIVCDFKRDSKMKSYSKKNPESIFKKIRIGNHNGYYRVVIDLDGIYKYDEIKISNGYLITLR